MVTGNADAARDILIKGIQHLPQCKVLLEMSSSQVYPTAAYVWPMQQHTFAAAPQSQPSAQPIAQIQTQVYQNPVQNNEPYGQTQSNYRYDPLLWEYHQQQQLQQQQQQPQLQDLPQVQQQQPPITASLTNYTNSNNHSNRWDLGVMEQLPEYMKVYYRALLTTVKEVEDELALQGCSYHIDYLKEASTQSLKKQL